MEWVLCCEKLDLYGSGAHVKLPAQGVRPYSWPTSVLVWLSIQLHRKDHVSVCILIIIRQNSLLNDDKVKNTDKCQAMP